MSKKILNSLPVNSEPVTVVKSERKLNQLTEDILYRPSDADCKVKARFWSRFEPGPLLTYNNITPELVIKLTGVTSITQNWYKPGFKAWFLNKDEAREKLEYLFMKSLDAAEQIITNEELQPSARVNMIKIIAELAAKFPTKKEEKYADKDINDMNESELKAYLDRKGVVIKQEKILDISNNSEDK